MLLHQVIRNTKVEKPSDLVLCLHHITKPIFIYLLSDATEFSHQQNSDSAIDKTDNCWMPYHLLNIIFPKDIFYMKEKHSNLVSVSTTQESHYL